MAITISVGGEEGFSRSLGVLEDKIDNVHLILEKVVPPILFNHMEQQFKTNGSFGGKPWAGYGSEPLYGAWKRRVAGHDDRLQMRPGFQRLRPSLTDKNNVENILKADKKGISFGTKVPYAAQLSKGGIGPFGEPYPGRKMFAFRTEQVNEITRAILREINQSLKSSDRGIGTARKNR